MIESSVIIYVISSPLEIVSVRRIISYLKEAVEEWYALISRHEYYMEGEVP